MGEQQTVQNENKTWDVEVVGGGLAGMAAAIYLARGGKSVLVLEKAPSAGGRAISLNKEGGIFKRIYLVLNPDKLKHLENMS